jgi:hypothetical protein
MCCTTMYKALWSCGRYICLDTGDPSSIDGGTLSVWQNFTRDSTLVKSSYGHCGSDRVLVAQAWAFFVQWELYCNPKYKARLNQDSSLVLWFVDFLMMQATRVPILSHGTLSI